ncbi:MAG: DUF1592 domain-containing protein [Acidobacteria bacterium]|nr:DUF1592 domain-containing protein [Acidobacteriota bacterium]MYJ02886.1 DUF1592 domain-containing protein [Acidobacteriota bacterium]
MNGQPAGADDVSQTYLATLVTTAVLALGLAAPRAAAAQSELTDHRALLDRYCVTCHNTAMVTGAGEPASPLVAQLRSVGLTLDTLDVADVGAHAADWERVVRKMRGGVMPPAGRPRPDAAAAGRFLDWLEGELDRAWAVTGDPGRTATFHRLNRTEYRNAIRDLLAVELEADDLLPADDASFGFDNIGGVLRMSQALMERYLAAARTVSRLAVGSPPPAVAADTYEAAQDLSQHARVERLPFGTRGGLHIEHLFPQDAEYEVRIQLSNARRLAETHDLEVTIDGEQARLIAVGPPAEGVPENPYAQASTIDLRLPFAAGPREVGVTFFRKPAALVEQVREPFANPRVAGNAGGLAGAQPFVQSVTITGPYDATGVSETPSRARIFTCRPASEAGEPACAREILTTLTRRAYRRAPTAEELGVLLDFYEQGRGGGSFEDGIELALRRLLVSPEFLYRIEVDPDGVEPGAPYRVRDIELASRLSFFLWSSIPDDELLDAAEAGRLGDPAELERQVRRMIVDPRSETLTTNFAAQWLQLRNLETTVRPGDPFSVAFDESLRQSMLRETGLFVDDVIRADHGIIELLTADYTFLNERLAEHYGIPGVTGSHFRRVTHAADSPRRGILGHGSILTLTSHAIRTSPVLRGKWILDNLLGTPPPDPPANVPALNDQRTQAKRPTLRKRMEEHRDNPACSACHAMIDPTGFALENFDAIGRWREVDESFYPIDPSGVLPDGRSFGSVGEMREALASRPEQFVTTVTEKLMTYALGRGLDYYDMPTVRRIVREAAPDYRIQSVILGIVTSDPFLMRRSQS